MKRRLSLQRPPILNNNFAFPLSPSGELSTFRTRVTKASEFQKTFIHQKTDRIEQKVKTHENSKLNHVLSLAQYYSNPVSMVSIWGGYSSELETLIYRLTIQYDGWLLNENKPDFHIITGRKPNTFIFSAQILMQNDSNKLIFQYLVSSIIFLLIKPNDYLLQDKILLLCETISDKVFYSTHFKSKKPYFVLIKLQQNFEYDTFYNQKKWISFVRKLNSWSHFIQIEMLEMQQKLFKSHDQTINTHYTEQKYNECCMHIKQILRKKALPQIMSGQKITGKVMIKNIQQINNSLHNKTYINIQQIFTNAISSQKQEFFKTQYSTFERLFTQKIQNQDALRKLQLYKHILDIRKQSSIYSNSLFLFGNTQIAKLVQKKCLKDSKTLVDKSRQISNNELFNSMHLKYLLSRPVAFTKCKQMLMNIKQTYINDGYLEDLKTFLVVLTKQYGNQLAWGDELNGLRLKQVRIKTIINQKKSKIQQIKIQTINLKNMQLLRLPNIQHKKSKLKFNPLSIYRENKIALQQQKIKNCKIILKSLNDIEQLVSSLPIKELQHLTKLNQIQLLNQQLKITREQEQYQKHNQIEIQKQRQKQKIKLKKDQQILKSETKKSETRQRTLSKEKKQNQIIRKKRKSICSCFGF